MPIHIPISFHPDSIAREEVLEAGVSEVHLFIMNFIIKYPHPSLDLTFWLLLFHSVACLLILLMLFLPGASVRNSACGKRHEEGGSA